MQNFMTNFNTFLGFFMSGLSIVYNWLINTIIGQIMIFVIIISIFIYIIAKLVEIGD